MTSGERMVWAAEFVRHRRSPGVAAQRAAAAVRQLREIGAAVGDPLDAGDLAMLADMLGTGGAM